MQPQTQKPFLLLLTMLILCSITTKPAQSQGQKRPNSTDRPETLSLDFWKMEFTRQNPLAPTLSNVAYGPDKQQVGIECHIVYPGTTDREFADPVQFLISHLGTVRK